MSAQTATIAGIGFWGDGLPDWASARAFAGSGVLPADAPAKPAPQLLAPNERRRAPPSVLVALEVALAACQEGRPSVQKPMPSIVTVRPGIRQAVPNTSEQLLPPKPKELFIA